MDRTEVVYKILTRSEWQAFRETGVFAGSADDQRDGFIHLSTASQVEGTLAKHFARRSDLVLLTLEAAALGEALRYERSRGGELFPHHYGSLTLNLVHDALPIKAPDAGP